MKEDRYIRQLILKGFGETSQQKLRSAKVLVIGAGGLGCPALQYLTAAGIGVIGIADDDIIALTNLHRQILYHMDDIGKLKVIVAAEKLSAINPEVKIIPYPVRITKNNVGILNDFDYVLDGTDNFTSRYVINDACVAFDKPLIFAAVSAYEGQVAIFNVPGTGGMRTNYRDLFPMPPDSGEVPNCAENGVIGVLPGIIGTMQAAELIKLITGIGTPLVNKLLNYNLLLQELYEIEITPSYAKKIIVHNDDDIVHIEGKKLRELLNLKSTLLIDVREPHEVPKIDKVISRQVPISTFDSFLQQDILEDNIILICQHGIRSVTAAERLKTKYGSAKNIFSLKGGIVKWIDYINNRI
ncbi:MAG: HesA/MoeB/ThiF family protein [Bacteroidota bacterium]